MRHRVTYPWRRLQAWRAARRRRWVAQAILRAEQTLRAEDEDVWRMVRELAAVYSEIVKMSAEQRADAPVRGEVKEQGEGA